MKRAKRVSATVGNWSFDLNTTAQSTSTITYYSGQADSLVIVPSVLGGADVTEIASQAFGHHSEIRAVYVPDSVKTVAEWAFYDLNEAAVLSFANPDVSIADGAFQSSGNAVLYLPEGTAQTSAGGKDVVTEGTEALGVAIVNPTSAAIAGGQYLNVPGDYAVSRDMVAAIAKSASGEESDVVYADGTVTFYGPAFEADEQQVEIYPGFADEISEDELTKTLWSLTSDAAVSLNEAIAADSSYRLLQSRLYFEEGYYINGNKVRFAEDAKAYDVQTGEEVSMLGDMFPSTGDGYYKFMTCRDVDDDGQVDVIYYSPFNVTYSYNNVTIISENENLNGLSSRDILNPLYLTFVNGVLVARNEGTDIHEDVVTAHTATDGDTIGAAINQERSVLWADGYGTITVDTLYASSTSFANWAKMSYVVGLSSYNVEIAMEWGMNALLYATNGGVVTVGSLDGPASAFTSIGDSANGMVAGGSGVLAGTEEAPAATASVYVYNADFILEGWNNHVADVVYGGYACLEKVTAVTGKPGSYAVGQSSALANDFGNGVVDAKDFHVTAYGNRSAGVYVIGGGVITTEDSSFISKMDAGMVTASGGTLKAANSSSTGQIGLRGRGGVSAGSSSSFTNVTLTAEKDIESYVTGEQAEQAVAAWESASGGNALIHFMMSDPEMTIGQLCANYGISESAEAALISGLSEIAGTAYTGETLLRNSVLDNTFYNYSAGAYTGSTDFSDIPYLTVGSAFGGLVSSVIEFESAGVTLNFTGCRFVNNNEADYQYLIASEAGSNLSVNFTDSDASGIIWNEGDVSRAVEGIPGARSSQMTVTFEDGSHFTGSFADGSNGLWEVSGLSYTDSSGNQSSLNGNYYGATANRGITAVFKRGSAWTVTHDSYLGSLTVEDGAVISTPEGYSLELSVNNTRTEINSRTYTGDVILTLTRN